MYSNDLIIETLFCGHCKQYVCKTVFYSHKKLYFDKVTRIWHSERQVYPEVANEFSFDDLDNSDEFLFEENDFNTSPGTDGG